MKFDWKQIGKEVGEAAEKTVDIVSDTLEDTGLQETFDEVVDIASETLKDTGLKEAVDNVVDTVVDTAADTFGLAVDKAWETFLKVLGNLLKEESSSNPTLDTAFGTIFIIVMVIGIPANLICCYYFSTQKSSHENGTYFKRIYTLISSLDLAICILLFPIIEGLLFQGHSESLLFHAKGFCYSWYAIWVVCQEMVIFMVAMLSVSRIVFLKYPHLEAKPNSAWIIPGIVAILVAITLFIAPLASSTAAVQYRPRYRTCQIKGKVHSSSLSQLLDKIRDKRGADLLTEAPVIVPIYDGNNSTFKKQDKTLESSPNSLETPYPADNVFDDDHKSAALIQEARHSKIILDTLKHPKKGLDVSLAEANEGLQQAQVTYNNHRTISLLRTSLFSLPVLPIFISFILCWIFLKRANAKAKKTNATVMKHGQASSTVLIVTLVYVIFNIPALIFSVFLFYHYTNESSVSSNFFTHFIKVISTVQEITVPETIEIWNWDADILRAAGKSVTFADDWLESEKDLIYYEDMFAAASFILLPALNSCLNPAIFFWRLQPFRNFIKNRFRHPR